MLHIFANIIDENIEANSVDQDQTAPVANNVNPDKTAPTRAVYSGTTPV